MELAAWFGIHPSADNRKMKVEQVGGLMKAAEREEIGNAGAAPGG
jgi:citrate lyase subunit beta/citryl-CoA lyase